MNLFTSLAPKVFGRAKKQRGKNIDYQNPDCTALDLRRDRGVLPDSPRVVVFLPREPLQHRDTLECFHQGLLRNGVNSSLVELASGDVDCDIAVTFGVGKRATKRGRQVGKIAAASALQSRPHLVIERGFVHRDRYFMAGWNGLNGRADFCNQDMPNDRWLELNTEVRPWVTSGDHVLVCGQVPWDSSVQHVNYPKWCEETLAEIRGRVTQRVIYRPHPEQPDAELPNISGVDVISSGSLESLLSTARAVVTFNSNAGVDAVLTGIPVFALDAGSMCATIADASLDLINAPNVPDRQQWLNNLAYTQWTIDEFSNGVAWQHLSA